MSEPRRSLDVSELPDPICWFCGERFDPDAEPDCTARDDGRCRP
ncbi:hypothetical protein [Haloglomus irregulare]|nr:hypothetical protein [Haloglomus irregulare]